MNSDDQGISPIIDDEDMGVKVGVAQNVIGSAQITVDAGYTINLSTLQLIQGASATVKIGTTPSGDEILMETELSSSNPNYTGLSNGNPTDPDAAFTAYIEVVGVGAAVNVRLQTIKNTQ